MKVFIDSDIILDFLLSREPFFNDALNLFLIKENKKFDLITSSIIISNVYYISRKLISQKILIEAIKNLTSIINIVDSKSVHINSALESDFSDFEDAVQYFTAIENKCTFLITRNTKDYTKAKNIRIVTSAQFCKLMVK